MLRADKAAWSKSQATLQAQVRAPMTSTRTRQGRGGREGPNAAPTLHQEPVPRHGTYSPLAVQCGALCTVCCPCCKMVAAAGPPLRSNIAPQPLPSAPATPWGSGAAVTRTSPCWHRLASVCFCCTPDLPPPLGRPCRLTVCARLPRTPRPSWLPVTRPSSPWGGRAARWRRSAGRRRTRRGRVTYG